MDDAHYDAEDVAMSIESALAMSAFDVRRLGPFLLIEAGESKAFGVHVVEIK